MTWLVLIALGMIPWVIAVNHVLRRQNPASRAKSAARREFDDALRRMLAPAAEVVPSRNLSGMPVSPQPPDVLDSAPHVQVAPQHEPVAAAAETSRPKDERTIAREKRMREAIRHVQTDNKNLPAGLSIIEGFVPGDDMLELTLDEDEVAAAEAAGVRLDVRVERASAGQGSLVTVGGTPLAFIRGNAQVTPRDVILRVEKVA
jgi:hypothetical protein